MLSEDAKNQLINDFIEEKKKSGAHATKPAAPKKPLIEDIIETDGTHAWGALTGHGGYWKDYKTTVYDPSDWPETVRKYIPKKDPLYEYTDEFFRLALCLDQRLTVMAVGRPGSGKDAANKQYCALRQIPYRRITGMAGTTPDMIVGSKTLADGNIEFNPGDAYLICRDGGMLVLSEPAAMPGDTMFAFQSALETGGYLSVLDHPDPDMRMLTVSDRTWFALTSNVRGVGDNAGLYASASNVLDASLVNRISSYVQFNYPEKELEIKILKNHFPTMGDEFADKVVKFGNLIRDAHDLGNVEFEWSLRSALPWIQMSLIYGDAAEGLRTTFFDKLSDTEKGVVRGFWKTVNLGGDL